MFYLVKIQNDSTQAVLSYEDIDEALSAYHSELAYRGNGRDKTVCVILDSDGFTLYRESWQKHVEPEPMEES